MGSAALVLVELLVVFGGLLAFGFWQLHTLRNDPRSRPATPPEDLPRDVHEN